MTDYRKYKKHKKHKIEVGTWVSLDPQDGYVVPYDGKLPVFGFVVQESQRRVIIIHKFGVYD